MALIACKECQKEISSTAAACPQCGAPTKAQRQPKVRPAFVVLLVISLGFIVSWRFLGSSGRTAIAEKIVGDIVIADRFDTLADGQLLSWKLEPAMYRVQMTANGDGATVGWIGADCAAATTETTTFNAICELGGPGQLTVTNPSVFGLGQSSNVSLKITRLAR